MANLAFQVPDSFREFNSGKLEEAIEKFVDSHTNKTDGIGKKFLQCKY